MNNGDLARLRREIAELRVLARPPGPPFGPAEVAAIAEEVAEELGLPLADVLPVAERALSEVRPLPPLPPNATWSDFIAHTAKQFGVPVAEVAAIADQVAPGWRG